MSVYWIRYLPCCQTYRDLVGGGVPWHFRWRWSCSWARPTFAVTQVQHHSPIAKVRPSVLAAAKAGYSASDISPPASASWASMEPVGQSPHFVKSGGIGARGRDNLCSKVCTSASMPRDMHVHITTSWPIVAVSIPSILAHPWTTGRCLSSGSPVGGSPSWRETAHCSRSVFVPECATHESANPLDGLYTLLSLRSPPSPARGGQRVMGASVSATESSRKFMWRPWRAWL